MIYFRGILDILTNKKKNLIKDRKKIMKPHEKVKHRENN